MLKPAYWDEPPSMFLSLSVARVIVKSGLRFFLPLLSHALTLYSDYHWKIIVMIISICLQDDFVTVLYSWFILMNVYIYIYTVHICLNIFSFVLETRSRFFILFIMYFVSLLPSSRHPAPGTESPAVFAAPLAGTNAMSAPARAGGWGRLRDQTRCFFWKKNRQHRWTWKGKNMDDSWWLRHHENMKTIPLILWMGQRNPINQLMVNIPWFCSFNHPAGPWRLQELKILCQRPGLLVVNKARGCETSGWMVDDEWT